MRTRCDEVQKGEEERMGKRRGSRTKKVARSCQTRMDRLSQQRQLRLTFGPALIGPSPPGTVTIPVPGITNNLRFVPNAVRSGKQTGLRLLLRWVVACNFPSRLDRLTCRGWTPLAYFSECDRGANSPSRIQVNMD